MSHVRIVPLKDPNYAYLTHGCKDPAPVAKFICDLRVEGDVVTLEELAAAHTKTCPGGVAA